MDFIKVLLAIDDIGLRELLSKGLNYLAANIKLSIVDSNSEAVKTLQQAEFDVLIVNYAPPKISGIELVMKARTIQNNLQSIVITGRGDVDQAFLTMHPNTINYVFNPATPETLHFSIVRCREKRVLLIKLRDE